MSMRIVGGKYRHRLIEYPNDASHIRPTKDRIREAIFNALGDISGLTVLDLYAGSGAMGIEALSRGAEKCYFVDKNYIAINTIKNNLSSLLIKDEAIVIKDEDKNALKSFINNNVCFDIVILDPPYAEGEYQNIIDILLENKLIKEHGIIIYESNYHLSLKEMECIKDKEYSYGEIKVRIIWR